MVCLVASSSTSWTSPLSRFNEWETAICCTPGVSCVILATIAGGCWTNPVIEIFGISFMW
eukprot:11584997-Prorocentrum_lima.AAC.1